MSKQASNIDGFLHNVMRKIDYYKEIIQKTIAAIQKYKIHDVVTANDVNLCIKGLEQYYAELNAIDLNGDKNLVVNRLQYINDELSGIFRTFGTMNIEDVLTICYGSNFLSTIPNCDVWAVLQKHVHPINYKILKWKHDMSPSVKGIQTIAKNRIVDDNMIVENGKMLDCFDLARSSSHFYVKVYGIKVMFHNFKDKSTLIISCIVDDVLMSCIEDKFVKTRIHSLQTNIPQTDPEFKTTVFAAFVKTLTLKELLIYSNDELYHRFIGHVSQTNLAKQRSISDTVKEFLGSDLYIQRTMLIQLLLKHSDNEYKYLAYLLYALLSTDIDDSNAQKIIYDSFPWEVKKFFKEAMKSTIQYTNDLSNFDCNKIPLEQQICLMKVGDNVKEKAMVKLKELKSKSEDSGSKARQYLDGLLKIPFGVYKSEEILDTIKKLKDEFVLFIGSINRDALEREGVQVKTSYSLAEINKICLKLKSGTARTMEQMYKDEVCGEIVNGKREKLMANIAYVNTLIKKHKYAMTKLIHAGKKVDCMKTQLACYANREDIDLREIGEYLGINPGMSQIGTKLLEFEQSQSLVQQKIVSIRETLDDTVYGHKKAKRQVERIIGQWINGEQSGYCLGFEGPPGLGKTSLAKRGIANCLKDDNGNSRPFAFIAIGGSSHGSDLNGHNYTYVGSTWGKIVDILMETKCMNPIIFIDELDKVSQTPYGKEIIGILTHLVDTTQNDAFQDKYFSGIDIDLSKVLFIFSYNDPSLIDKILLDRIHRITFDPLTLTDKLVITRKYLLPELYKKFNLEDHIEFSEEVIELLINAYTDESGVRKLKETLFEIISEINLDVLNGMTDVPVVLTPELLRTKYLKDRTETMLYKIHAMPAVGLINGLWANSIGKGGVLPIESSWYHSGNKFDLKLTGMLGDVMKESINVAKSLAWNKAGCGSDDIRGIHVHCPDGSTLKDGPSAGVAITLVIYSLLKNKPIKNDIAVTGEITLRGDVTAIGGLELKIMGGLKSGVKTFIFPAENDKDFAKIKDRHATNHAFNEATYISVKTIDEVLQLVFE
jgi:ATP-dependent Lon protease